MLAMTSPHLPHSGVRAPNYPLVGLNPIRGLSSFSASLLYYPWPLEYLKFITYNLQVLFCNLSFSSAVGFCFIFASFLMLLTTICFLIGAPVQTVCKSIQTGEIYSQVCEMRTSWNKRPFKIYIIMYTHLTLIEKVYRLPAV